MLRALAETIALLADFGIDEVTDIRLALEEVATELMQGAVAGSELDCHFEYEPTAMRIRVTAILATAEGLRRQGIGWHIVQTLTDTLTTAAGPFDTARGGYPTTVEFRWVRGGSR
jgi:serine/threonine-protein kinase RsbW